MFLSHVEQADPYGLTVTFEGEETAEVTWYEPILNDGSTVTGYNVTVHELLQDDESVYYDGYTTTETQIMLTNLQPYTNYSVSICALTTGGDGSVEIPVTTIQISTTEAGKL